MTKTAEKKEDTSELLIANSNIANKENKPPRTKLDATEQQKKDPLKYTQSTDTEKILAEKESAATKVLENRKGTPVLSIDKSNIINKVNDPPQTKVNVTAHQKKGPNPSDV